jgi:methylglutaconyl-CoA hydratase
MLKVDLKQKVARVMFDRPDLHNAFNDEMIALVTGTFAELGGNPDVRAIVLGGNGKSFCAGADLNWMKRMAEYTREQNMEDAKNASRMFSAIARCPKPVIARVHGAALGGGAGVVAACDISVAAANTQFGFSEVRMGIVPGVISPFVIARIGIGRARELFLTGERFSAQVAHNIGLLHHVTDDETAMDALIETKVEHILQASPAAIAAAKALIFGVAARTLDTALDFTAAAIADARASQDGQAGMKAFLAREKPPWADR